MGRDEGLRMKGKGCGMKAQGEGGGGWRVEVSR